MTAARTRNGGPEFYTPPMPEPVKANEGRFVPNRMENDAVMRRISRNLYASPTAGVRELLANEITAARAAKRLGADPRIQVTIRRDQIVVWGIDSLGMERRIFDDIYTVLGRSGNFDGTTPGQFGFGRAAYVTLSDTMLLETHHRNGDRYAVRGIDGAGFETGLPEPDIPYGTRVTLEPRDGTNIGSLKLEARLIAGRCEIPMTLTTRDGTETPERWTLGSSHSFLSADLPDAEVSAELRSTAHVSFLCGIPISFRYRGRHDISVAVDIHDERKYPPTPDRERMTEESERAISGIIDREIGRRMAGFPADINEAMDHPDRNLACRLGLGPPELRELVAVYNPESFLLRDNTYLGMVDGSPVLYSKSTVKDGKMDAVLAKHPSAKFVMSIPAPAGLTTVEEFMERHGIRPPADTKTPAVLQES